MATSEAGERSVRIPVTGGFIDGSLLAPAAPSGLVVIAHGSGSSRFSRRNRQVAGALVAAGFAVLLLNLLTQEEEPVDALTGRIRFDIPLLGRRVVAAIDWAGTSEQVRRLPLACFGASTGAAAALVAAACRPDVVRAVVSRGGRPDLAGAALADVDAATLLLVGEADPDVLALNREAMRRMRCYSELVVVPGASHLFEEPGALDLVCRHAVDWCRRFLTPAPSTSTPVRTSGAPPS